MTLVHVVLVKAKPTATAEQVEQMVSALNGMKSHIDVIQSVSAGANFSDRSNGFTHGLVVQVQDKEALSKYLEHPHHVHVVNAFIKPAIEDLLAVDYEL